MFSCALCFLCQTVSFSKSAYPSSPQYFQEGLWIYWWCCGISSDADLALLQLVSPSKTHNCPQSLQSQANCKDVICCTCSLAQPGWAKERCMADTAEMRAECLKGRGLWEVASLRLAMCSPSGIGPGSFVPQQSQATSAPRNLWAETCACSQLGGSCDFWGQHHSNIQSPTSGTRAGFGHGQPAGIPTSRVVNCSHGQSCLWHSCQSCRQPANMSTYGDSDFSLTPILWHSQRQCPAVCEHTDLEGPHDNDLLPLWQARLSLDSLSCAILALSEYLHGSQPQSSPWSLTLKA